MKHLMKTLAVSLFVAGGVTASADNLLTDTKFSKESGWHFWVNEPVVDAGGSGMLQDGKAVAKSPAIEKQNYMNIQLIRSIDVEADKSYKVKFRANAEKGGSLIVSYNLCKSPYTAYARADVYLNPGEKEYECTLAIKKGGGNYDAPRSLRLFFGAFKDATVSVSDVSFEEVK